MNKIIDQSSPSTRSNGFLNLLSPRLMKNRLLSSHRNSRDNQSLVMTDSTFDITKIQVKEESSNNQRHKTLCSIRTAIKSVEGNIKDTELNINTNLELAKDRVTEMDIYGSTNANRIGKSVLVLLTNLCYIYMYFISQIIFQYILQLLSSL